MASGIIHDQLRSIILQCLRKERPFDPRSEPFRVEHLLSEVAEVAKKHNLKARSDTKAWHDNHGKLEIHPTVISPVWDVVWDLIIEGVLRPGDGKGNNSTLPYIHLTEYGKNAIKDETTPYDADGYLKRLSDKVPNADPIIIKYIAESAETFRRHCLLASTITLGCASEKAFLLLLEAYGDALTTADKGAFDKEIQACRGIKQKHGVFMKCYESKIRPALKTAKMNSDWLTGLEDGLNFVFGYFRAMRNDAGHPTGTVLDKELVHSHLVVFPFFLRTMYDLIDWLNKNKPI